MTRIPTSQPHIQPRFGGAESAMLPLKGLGLLAVPVQILRVMEDPSLFSWAMAGKDTASSWGSRAMARRSKAELLEITVAEIIQNFLVYFAVPLLGGHLFKNLFYRLAGGEKAFPKHLMTQKIAEIAKDNATHLPKALFAKTAVVIASLGTSLLAGEFVLNYGKNLMTERVFRQHSFSDVVNLSQGKLQAPGQESANAKKFKRRIKQSLAAAGGVVVFSAALAHSGAKLPKIFHKMAKGFLAPEGSLGRFFKGGFDFHFTEVVRDGKKVVENGFVKQSVNLGWGQVFLYMVVTLCNYMDAARDGLERKEILSRMPVICAYLLWGSSLLKRLSLKPLQEKFPQLLNADNELKKVDIIRKELLEKAGGNQAKALEEFRRVIKPKLAFYYGLEVALGFALAAFVAQVSRYWTQKRFERSEKQKQTAQAPAVPPPLPQVLRARQPLMPSVAAPAPAASGPSAGTGFFINRPFPPTLQTATAYPGVFSAPSTLALGNGFLPPMPPVPAVAPRQAAAMARPAMTSPFVPVLPTAYSPVSAQNAF